APHPIDVATLERWLGVTAIADDLRRIEVSTPGGLLGDLVATQEDLGGISGARIQTDDGLHLEFFAPLGFYGRKRMPPLSYLPPLNVDTVGRAVKGRKAEWGEACDFSLRGMRGEVEVESVGGR